MKKLLIVFSCTLMMSLLSLHASDVKCEVKDQQKELQAGKKKISHSKIRQEKSAPQEKIVQGQAVQGKPVRVSTSTTVVSQSPAK